ncbi:MAG TPA: hypothetical protein VI111_06075 [Thermoleophilaceae bacterium]
MEAHERYDQTGAVQAQVLALLNDYGEGDFTTTIAQRSPLGPRTVRIGAGSGRERPSQVACEDLAAWLASQPAVDAVSARPPHVYLRVSTDALRAWVADGFSVIEGTEGANQLAVVRFAEPDGQRPRTLDEFREAAMGRAVVALLGSRGFDLVIERVVAGEEPEPTSETEFAATRVVVGGAFPHDAEDLLAPVGGIDVRHGALRARHGGSVSAEDLLGDISGERLTGRFTREADTEASKAYAEALLTFALLRTGRARRVQLDEDKLKREAADFNAIREARALPRTGVVDDAGEDAVRELAVELDLLPIIIGRAAQALEPSFLTRFARSLAERTRAARAYMPATDPLWPAVDEAIDLALSMAGIHVPPEVWNAASRAPLGPEQPHPWVDLGPTGGGWAHRASLN